MSHTMDIAERVQCTISQHVFRCLDDTVAVDVEKLHRVLGRRANWEAVHEETHTFLERLRQLPD